MGNKYIMRNCYWRHEYQDMNATVPTCDYYGQYGSCPCKDECEHYISEQDVENIIRKRVEAGHSHEDGQWFDLTDALTVERNEWIPCSERLPSDDEYVIVSVLDDHGDTPWEYTTVAWLCNGVWISDNDILCGTAVAWMPLPEPYEGGDDDEERN